MSADPVVIMADRGCMDGWAYMESSEWDLMLKKINKSELEVWLRSVYDLKCGRRVITILVTSLLINCGTSLTLISTTTTHFV
jgi:hypothetical protein